MFGGMGLYYYLLHKERKPASVYMKKQEAKIKTIKRLDDRQKIKTSLFDWFFLTDYNFMNVFD